MFESSEALRGGSAVHEAAETLAKWGSAYTPGSQEPWRDVLWVNAESRFQLAWENNAEEGDDPTRYAKLFKVYVTMMMDRIQSTLNSGKELHLAWKWAWPKHIETWMKDPELKLRGIADEIGSNISIHNFYGKDWIVDLKTNKLGSLPFKEDHRDQVHMYAIMYYAKYGKYPDGVALWYLDGNVWVIYQPVDNEYMLYLRNDIEYARNGIENEDWRAKPHKFCDWCPGQGDCPEFNS